LAQVAARQRTKCKHYMYWNHRFAIVVSLIWAALVTASFLLLAGAPVRHRTPAVPAGRPHRTATLPVGY
jgi:hypothetical protein